MSDAAPLPFASSAWSRWGSTLAYSFYLTHTKSYGLFDASLALLPVRVPAVLA